MGIPARPARACAGFSTLPGRSAVFRTTVFRKTVALAFVVFCFAFSGSPQTLGSEHASKGDFIRMDDFKKTYPPGKIPKKWTAKYHAPFFGKGDRAFIQFIHKGPGEHYIHMASGKDNYFSLAVLKPFWTKDWPVLEWEWKITKLPKGADVRVPKKDDQAGSVCLIIDLGSFGFGSALCYLYENSGPKHKVIHHPTNKKSRYFFLRTGKADGVNRWYKERRNIFEDYRKAFGKALKKKGVIVFQIDSNSTESSAEAFYRNIYQRKR